MPDIGGIGRGLLKGALSVTEKAAEKVKDAAEAASRKMADDDPEATQVVASDPDATQVVKDADPDPERTQVLRNAPGRQRPQAPPAPAPAMRPEADFPSAHGESAARAGVGYSSAHREPAMRRGLDLPSVSGEPAMRPGVDLPPVSGEPAVRPPVDFPSASGLLTEPASPGTSGGLPGGSRPATSVPPAETAVESEPSLDDEPEDHADASEVLELVEMFHQLLVKRRPPAGPIPEDWSLGIGDLLAEHPKVPKRARGLITKLNRFGGVAFSPQEVTFDGDDVPWEKVTEVRTRHVVDYLVGDAIEQQVESLPVPWFPGRKRLLDALGQAILTVTIATAKDQLDKIDVDFRVPAEIVYKGSFGRSKELNAGVVSALVLADPAINQSLVATARARGVTVTAGDDEMLADADERAEEIRKKVKALEAELDRFTKRFGRKN